MTHARFDRKLPVALALALAMVLALLGTVTLQASTATAATATVSASKYQQLRQQRNKKVKQCKAKVKKAQKRVKKAQRQLKKAKKAKAKRNARKRVKKARKNLKKAKKQSTKCVKNAKQRYRNQISKLAPEPTGKAQFKATGSVGDAYVTGASDGQELILVNGNEKQVSEGTVDSWGSLVFYGEDEGFKPGAGYSVRLVEGKKVLSTPKFKVLAPDDNPAQSWYQQQAAQNPIQPGLNFVKMRDGIELAVTYRKPAGAMPAGGWPTILEISGYETAPPHDMLGAILGGGTDVLAPSTSTAVGALIAPQAKFASLSVQMRGTGCSGGAYGLFDLPTTYDGYDMVELAAAQAWSSGQVGLAGISYSGISQLFVGGTKPPHLKGITPLSVTPDLYTGTGYPGGMFNQGFALSWITDRVNDAKPAPGGGQAWATEIIENGDPLVTDPVVKASQQQHCLQNQILHNQTRDVFQMIQDNAFRTPEVFNNRSPQQWLAKTDVPVFLAGAFQDEQTGGEFPNALAGLKDNPNAYFMIQNGVHVDALGPSVITAWGDFLNLFVAERLPEMPPLLVGMAPVLYGQLADAPSLPIRESEYKNYPDWQTAKADFIANTPRLTLLMENGSATKQGDSDPSPGTPVPGGIGANWKVNLDDWPVPQTEATDYYLGAGGALDTTKDGASSEASYVSDPSARHEQSLDGSDEGAAWVAQPPYHWDPVVDGKGLGFTTDALADDVLIAGPSSLDLKIKSTETNTDIQATISEVRPDGEETYVQSGWLRATHRALDTAKSTAVLPVQTHLLKDAEDLTPGEYTEMRIPIFPVGHLFRAGSKIRVSITAVGGDRARWNFATTDDGSATNTIELGGAEASKLVLPVIPQSAWKPNMEQISEDGLSYEAIANPPALPGSTALRGQPTRTWEAASNGG